jgi:oxygen-independent coproporphyrinogen-3 oxidase
VIGTGGSSQIGTGGSGEFGVGRSGEFGVGRSGEFGVYVHVPFCRSRCDYCAFATYTDVDHLMGTYVDACVAQLVAARDEGLPPATSVFFGGGTPSRLPADELCRVLAAISRAEGAEVTVECNPEDIDPARLATYIGAGVTRVSLGVQSTREHVLAGLGRVHDRDRVRQALGDVAGAALVSWNVDLIMGGAGESDADWEATLTDVLDLASPPPHVSAYALTVEPGTPLAADPDRHPGEDTLADRYLVAEQCLTEAGYGWEEISNWALPGHECRHNGLYWRQGDYLGVGSAAHSHCAGRRWWNLRTPARYIAAVTAGTSITAGEEHLTPADRRFEALALALRTPAGVPEAALPATPELDALVTRSGGRAVLTATGRLLANEITAHLIVEADDEPPVGRADRRRPIGILQP